MALILNPLAAGSITAMRIAFIAAENAILVNDIETGAISDTSRIGTKIAGLRCQHDLWEIIPGAERRQD